MVFPALHRTSCTPAQPRAGSGTCALQESNVPSSTGPLGRSPVCPVQLYLLISSYLERGTIVLFADSLVSLPSNRTIQHCLKFLFPY